MNQNELERIFSADVVLGEKAVELGLIDKIGIVDEVMEEKHKDLKILDFSRQSPIDELKEKWGGAAKMRM